MYEEIIKRVKLFEAGQKWRIDFGKGNINNKTIHVCAIVDGHIVYKYWLKHKQRWAHSIDLTPACIPEKFIRRIK